MTTAHQLEYFEMEYSLSRWMQRLRRGTPMATRSPDSTSRHLLKVERRPQRPARSYAFRRVRRFARVSTIAYPVTRSSSCFLRRSAVQVKQGTIPSYSRQVTV